MTKPTRAAARAVAGPPRRTPWRGRPAHAPSSAAAQLGEPTVATTATRWASWARPASAVARHRRQTARSAADADEGIGPAAGEAGGRSLRRRRARPRWAPSTPSARAWPVAGGRRPAPAAGAASSTTCALVPLKPNALTPADARPSTAGHGVTLGRHHDRRTSSQAMCGFGSCEVQVRRDRAVLQRQHRLDQPGDAGRRLEVADVGLHRAERAAASPGRARRRSTAPSACTSIGSPSAVPVPWAST